MASSALPPPVPQASSVRAGAGMRVLRAAVFTAVCVVLAAAGHSVASGRTVPGWTLAAGWLAVFAVVAPLAGRERTLPGIAAGLAVGQLALHAVFNAGQLCATGSAAPAGAGRGLMAVAARLVCDGQAARLSPLAARQVIADAGLDPAVMGMPMNSAHAAVQVPLPLCSLPMLLGHLLAATVAGWLLRRGEVALWRLVRLSVRGTAGLAAFSPAALRRAHALLSALTGRLPGLPPRPRTTQVPARHRTVWLRHGLAGRAPPLPRPA